MVSQTAQVAEQQGKYLGKKLKKLAATGHTQLQNMDIKDDMCVDRRCHSGIHR